MSLQPGTRLGPYKVVAPMGAGEDARYRATDTRVEKVVAIKVLPPGSVHEDTRARLERDVKTVSSLRHPHISAPVEVGHEEPSTDFVVSEHVDGETLAERLAREPMDLQEALQIAVAVADSLDKAHRRGIVHGGLSPSTVVLGEGGPRLLDFGLVAVAEASSGVHSGDALPTMVVTRPSTLSAMPPAAAPYIAPERWGGSPADARSDVFACGALIYEMVTGRAAFQEKTQALLVAALQSVDPDPVSTIKPGVPAALDHVVRRCLHRDPSQRLQTAWDLLVELRWIAEGGSQVGGPVAVAPRSKTGERVLWAAAAVTAAIAAGLGPSAASSFQAAPEPRAVRFTVSGLERNAGVPVTISPDGRWVAGSPQGGSEVLGVSLASVTPQRLVSSGDTLYQPFWSPDSRSVAFFGRGNGAGMIRRAEISGAPPQTLAEAPLPVGNGTWNREGVILFSSAGVIRRVLAAGGEATPVTNLNEKGEPITGEDHLGPWFLPDGRHFLYVAVSSDSAIYLAELGSTARTRLIAADSKPMYAEPGYILFSRGDTIFAQPFDAAALKLTGEPIRVTDGVAMIAPTANPNLARSANFWVSQTGALVFKSVGTAAGRGAAAPAATAGAARSLVWVDRTGVETTQAGTGAFAGIDLAPDGRRFAVHLHEGSGGDIWTFDPAQGRMQRFTFSAGQENSSPIWSPDGKQIAYASQRDNQWGLYVRPADGTGTEELVTASTAQKVPMSWSPDGRWLVYAQSGKGSDVWAIPLAGDKKPIAVLDSDANEDHPQVSPDGKWIAYTSTETGRTDIFIKQFPEGPAKQQVSTGVSAWPRWRGDGRELYFMSAAGMQSVELDTSGPTPKPGVPRTLFGLGGNPNLQGHPDVYHRFAVSSDGQRFLLSRPGGGRGVAAGGADAVITQLVDGGRVGGQGNIADITVVLNWPQLLKQRAK